jgi:hypothetical protein
VTTLIWAVALHPNKKSAGKLKAEKILAAIERRLVDTPESVTRSS